MKKKTVFTIAGIAVSALAVAAVIVNKHLEIKKEEDILSVIGGQDGPTAYFVAGKFPKKEHTESAEEKHDDESLPNEKLWNGQQTQNESLRKEDMTEQASEVKPSETKLETDESEDDTHLAFFISNIPDDIFEKMQGKSYKEDCTVDREELRYVHVLHTGFDGEIKEGELIVNEAIAEDVLEIFEELFRAKYPIEKVRLVDEYDADDESSMSDNNSSAFNFRFISHTTKVSKHGLGLAIDINPLYNPYVKTVDGKLSIEPANSTEYVDRDKENPYQIDHDDLCYKLFTEHGFTWGGDWNSSKDYQHFEKVK
ncbi:MAG: M15 family metallopeptidase [bacterium]|nr:M15 family metallopeptidase [bacterium]